MSPRRVRSLLFLGCVLLAPGAALARGLCDAVGRGSAVIVVVSAFPAELAPIVAAAAIKSTKTVDGRKYYVGRVGRVHVVLGLTGIGTVNARDRASSVIKHFRPAAIIMSGVAGAPDIGDVVLASEWVETGLAPHYPVNPALLALGRRAANALPEPLDHCANVPPTAPTHTVCLLTVPAVLVGGLGESGDPFNGQPFPCTPGGSEVFGCDLPAPAETSTPVLMDMESGSVAHAADLRKVPFLAVRSGSDGGGDPAGNRGFPAQFFDFYRLAARNEAIVTRALLGEIARLAKTDPATCRLLAHRQWDRAAARIAPAQ